jgi:hypothetical protein
MRPRFRLHRMFLQGPAGLGRAQILLAVGGVAGEAQMMGHFTGIRNHTGPLGRIGLGWIPMATGTDMIQRPRSGIPMNRTIRTNQSQRFRPGRLKLREILSLVSPLHISCIE